MTDKHYGVSKNDAGQNVFVEVHDPGSTGRVIEEIFVFMAVDDDGSEGIMGFKSREGWVPMVASEPQSVTVMAEIAAHMGEASHKKVHLVKFSAREIERTIFDPS
jgi:hypothetical protein